MPGTFSHPSSPNESLDDIISVMNEAAGKRNTRQSPRKRKATDGPDDPSLPPRRRLSDSHNQATQQPASRTEFQQRKTRSQSKASTVPGHQSDGKVPSVPAVSEPRNPIVRKTRQLARKPANPSPLKDHGVVSTSALGVDLSDSPEKRRRGKRKPAVPVVEVPVLTRSRGQARSTVVSAPGLLHQDKAQSSDSVARDRRDAAVQGQKQAEIPDASNGRERRKGDNVIRATQLQREALLVNKEDTVAQLVNPIASLADLYDCRRFWEDILFNAYQIRELRPMHQARSDKGKRFCRRLERLNSEYQRLKDDNNPRSFCEPIEILKQRLASFDDDDDDEEQGERAYKGGDLNQLVVPELVFLLRTAAQARSLQGNPSFTAWKELRALIKVIVDAAALAYAWRQSHVSAYIQTSVFLVQKSLEKLTRRIYEESYREEQARLSYADQQRLYEDIRSRHERLLRLHRQPSRGWSTTGVRAAIGQNQPQDLSQSPEVIDIDDIDDV